MDAPVKILYGFIYIRRPSAITSFSGEMYTRHKGKAAIHLLRYNRYFVTDKPLYNEFASDVKMTLLGAKIHYNSVFIALNQWQDYFSFTSLV